MELKLLVNTMERVSKHCMTFFYSACQAVPVVVFIDELDAIVPVRKDGGLIVLSLASHLSLISNGSENNHLTSMALLKDLSVPENAHFGINDFLQLTHPSSAGSSQGQLDSLRKQSVGVVHQNQEFSIQNKEQLKIAMDMDMPVRS